MILAIQPTFRTVDEQAHSPISSLHRRTIFRQLTHSVSLALVVHATAQFEHIAFREFWFGTRCNLYPCTVLLAVLTMITPFSHISGF